MTAALRWRAFAQARPDLAVAGQRLLYLCGVGLAFLATVRMDGGPRVHPFCPVIGQGGLYGFLEPGPKREDLHRDGRFALHGFPPADNEDAIYLTGQAVVAGDVEVWAQLERQFLEERQWSEPPPTWGSQQLFEFLIETCLVTRTTGHGDFAPQHTIWHAT
jgi:hypothetical protein